MLLVGVKPSDPEDSEEQHVLDVMALIDWRLALIIAGNLHSWTYCSVVTHFF